MQPNRSSKILPRWIDTETSSRLVWPSGVTLATLQRSGHLWSAHMDGERVGALHLSMASAKIAVANARARKLMPERVIADEQYRENSRRRRERREATA